MWSEEGNEVILVELTVGDESNFSDQVERKQARLTLMYVQITLLWRYFTLEIILGPR